MNFRNRVIFLSSIGLGLGAILGTVITAITATGEYADGTLYLTSREFTEFAGSPLRAFVIQAVLCGIYGMIGMGGSAVYKIEQWSVLKSTIVHFCITLSFFYFTAFFLHWISPSNVQDCLLMFFIFLIPYIIIWLSNYLYNRHQVALINKELLDLRNARA